jgi:hypothetical protein
MPLDARDIAGFVFANGSATLRARIIDAVGNPVGPSAVASATMTVWLLDDQDPAARTAVAGQQGVAVTPAAVLTETLAIDAAWTRDNVGFNFQHTLDVSVAPAFPAAGSVYLVEYLLTPTVGQVIVVRFRCNCI